MTENENPFARQLAFGADSFADNPEPRCPCVLLLDRSGSMAGQPIDELNAGLAEFRQDLLSDGLAAKRVETTVISFGPVTIDTAFHTAHSFIPPILAAGGDTPMGAAINLAIDALESRKAEYRANGISYYRPWIFLITDGAPTDEWKAAAARVREGEAAKKFAFFAVGVNQADMGVLRQISTREPLSLSGLKFRELFQWLSGSLGSVSQSTPGTEVALKAPTGWAVV
ncbi:MULTISPECIES: vWA domain-containing protein [Paraburkholderia]|uniref:Uncharacterized conserved protein YegL, contains vWA domain of TerY type n=1 Tax=Paraburkholderia diazotrophica TaxID=667676 RepID=A0A1H7DXC5_9BURK|nr:VWA domain-containing protein [Paraburkholderia diazotrophica]SEK06218.1 Uncharacterized conserved protein YegL, contains vWA domain of TerY type [Paraburkholderia diazotrophica]